MARIFVTRDDPDATIRVEVYADPEGEFWAVCSECGEIISGFRERYDFADTMDLAEVHVDQPHTD